MLSIGLGKILDAEVIDGKSEGGRAGGVTPEAGGVSDGRVIIGG